LKKCLFVSTEFTNVTDKQTPHASIGRDCTASRGKNYLRTLYSTQHTAAAAALSIANSGAPSCVIAKIAH